MADSRESNEQEKVPENAVQLDIEILRDKLGEAALLEITLRSEILSLKQRLGEA